MISQVKELLEARGWRKAAIVDDAYDTVPSIDDISPEKWDTFIDDLTEADRQILSSSFPAYEDYPESIELARAPGFIEMVWSNKDEISSNLSDLIFEEFEQDRKNMKQELVELETLLNKLGLEVSTKGRTDAVNDNSNDVIFLDLFIGPVNTSEAYQHSVTLIKRITNLYKGNPPVIILMSTSPRIEKLGPQLRDEADLLGCLFRKIRKSDLSDEGAVLERIYDLAVAYDDALKLQSFHKLWRTTLNSSADKFLKMVRKLDLSDYANIHSLVIDAEGIEIGEYMIDLFDAYLHYVVEGNPDLVTAAQNLNDVKWDQYPPPHFSPSSEAVEILEGTIFHNTARSDITSAAEGFPQLHLGDIVWENQSLEITTDNSNEVSPSAGEQSRNVTEIKENNVLVLLTQSCDLLRNETDTLLFMRGTANPYSLKYHKKPSKDITPIISVDDEKYVINWNPKLPETWNIEDAGNLLGPRGKYKVVRRFRHPYALQLQQSFLSTLGRVGVPSPLPGYYPVGAKVFFRDNTGNASIIIEITRDQNLVICLAGRDENNVITRIIFDREFIDILRNELIKIEPGRFHDDSREIILSARDDIKFYMALKHPLRFSKSQRERPFSDKPDFDIIHLFNRPILKSGSKIEQKEGPIVIEIAE